MVRESWRKTGRCRCWWRYRKNLGTKNTPTVRQGPCRLSCKTCMAAVTLFPPATHDAATSTATLIARPTWRKTDCCYCLLSQRKCSQKNTATVQLGSCRSARHTRWCRRCPLLAGRSTVVAKTRCRLGRSAVHGWPAAMQISARLH